MRSLVPRPDPPSTKLLMRILERPGLVAAVRELPGAVLGKLIDRIGLEDAGELVALATTAQLERVFDDDLWGADRAGGDETFRPERFALWLRVMMEAGEAALVERLCELPQDLVALAVHRLETLRPLDLVGVVACMVFARTAAMGFNRWADRDIDALNPRTAGRALPSGQLSATHVVLFVAASSLCFVAATGLFVLSSGNYWPLVFSAPLLASWSIPSRSARNIPSMFRRRTRPRRVQEASASALPSMKFPERISTNQTRIEVTGAEEKMMLSCLRRTW